jgi:hypothetical protein
MSRSDTLLIDYHPRPVGTLARQKMMYIALRDTLLSDYQPWPAGMAGAPLPVG